MYRTGVGLTHTLDVLMQIPIKLRKMSQMPLLAGLRISSTHGAMQSCECGLSKLLWPIYM